MKIGKIPIFLLKSGGNDVKVLKQNEKRGPLNRSEFGNCLPEPTEPNVCQNGSAELTRTDASIYHYFTHTQFSKQNKQITPLK